MTASYIEGVARVLIPLPDHDFDVTEVAVPWKILSDAGHDVVFATEAGGRRPEADQRLLDGVIFGQLGAAAEAIAFYTALHDTAAFQAPQCWSELDVAEFDALVLPGGHAPRMRQYLGSTSLQQQVARFWKLERPVGAICHGVIVLARSIDPDTGRSVIHDSRTTCLVKYMERSAFALTAWKLGRYYRTYPAYVEDEVRSVLRHPAKQFVVGPRTLTKRGTATDDRHASVVEDGRYISARWPGDAYLFARRLAAQLDQNPVT